MPHMCRADFRLCLFRVRMRFAAVSALVGVISVLERIVETDKVLLPAIKQLLVPHRVFLQDRNLHIFPPVLVNSKGNCTHFILLLPCLVFRMIDPRLLAVRFVTHHPLAKLFRLTHIRRASWGANQVNACAVIFGVFLPFSGKKKHRHVDIFFLHKLALDKYTVFFNKGIYIIFLIVL